MIDTLARTDWLTIAKRFREADAAVARIETGLATAFAGPIWRPWSRLSLAMDWRRPELVKLAQTHLGRRSEVRALFYRRWRAPPLEIVDRGWRMSHQTPKRPSTMTPASYSIAMPGYRGRSNYSGRTRKPARGAGSS
jgi:hypothetical protein